MLRNLPSGASTVTIHTGNTLIITEAKKKATENTGGELIEGLKYVHKEKYNITWEQENTALVINEEADYNDIDLRSPVGRQGSYVYLKVFVPSLSMTKIEDCITSTMISLKVDVIDYVILACRGGECFFPEEIKVAWMVIEDLVYKGKIKYLGVSDIDAATFTGLFEWALIKPKFIEIHLSQILIVSPDLIQYAEQNSVEVVTHLDPYDILPAETLRKELLEMEDDDTEAHFATSWVTRYQILHQGTSVRRGFIVKVHH